MSYPTKVHKVHRGPVVMPEEAIPAWKHPEALAYLTQRGLSRDEIERYDLRFCDGGLWRNRVIIPMYGEDGTLAAFQGRAIDDHPKRYITEGNRPLYTPWNTLDLDDYDEPDRELVIVEGPFDLFSVLRVRPAVALLGARISKPQWFSLGTLLGAHRFRRVRVWLDATAQEEAYALQLQLGPYLPTDVIETADAKDPGDLGREAVVRGLA